MVTWSLCMIVKNEENNISNCLKSVKDLFDEIIIVDTGSSDNTKEIVKKYTDNIYDFTWIDDFSAARNYSFSKATKDYIMWLDADDVIKIEDLKKLKKLKKSMTKDTDIIMLKYNIAFDENNKPTFSYYRERLLKRENNYKWKDKVHECIELFGNIKREDIAITHNKIHTGKSDRNLNIYKKMEEDLVEFSPRNLYYYGRELCDHLEYEKAIEVLNKFLETKKGWVEDNIFACYLLSNCYKSLNNNTESLNCLFKSFYYDVPRKKTCCLIANNFMNEEKYHQAIHWYKLSLQLPINENLGFYESDYDYFIPYINLCVCYDKLGDQKTAKEFHLLSAKIKPNHQSVKYNEEYFNNK